MLQLKSLEFHDPHVRLTYCVRHNVGTLPTTLEQDLTLRVNAETGRVNGELMLSELQADSVDAARLKMAEWCERMAAALRSAVKMEGAELPFYTRAPFTPEALPPHLQQQFERVVWDCTAAGEEGIPELIRGLVAQKHPLVYIPDALACAEAQAYRALGLD